MLNINKSQFKSSVMHHNMQNSKQQDMLAFMAEKYIVLTTIWIHIWPYDILYMVIYVILTTLTENLNVAF